MQRLCRHGAMLWVGLIFLVILPEGTKGAVIYLRDGDRLTGVIKSVGTDGIVITTRWRENVKIPMSEIDKLEKGDVLLPRKAIPLPAVSPAKGGQSKKAGGKGKPAAAVASAPIKPKKPKRWKGSVRLGMDLLFSEKKRQLYSGRLKLAHLRKHYQTSLDYMASYGQTDGDVSANRMEGSSKTDYTVTDDWYVYNLGSAGYDRIRKVNLRYELGPGMGYRVVKSKTLNFNTEAGMNYKAEDRSDGTDTELVVVRLSEDLEWRATPTMTLEERFEFLPKIDDWGTYRFRFEGNMEYRLMGNVSLNLTVINQYDTTPAKNVQQNDLQVRSSVGLAF